MRATIVSFSEVQVGRKKTPATKMVYRTEAGDEREYNILKFNKDQLSLISDMNPGDQVDIQWEKNSKGFWDLKGMVHTDFPTQSSSESTAEAGPSTTDVGGYKRGEWKKDPDKNRGIALSYALQHVLPQVHTKEELLAMDYGDFVKRATDVADLLLDYVENRARKDEVDADIPTPAVDDDGPH